jgi:hypothetical protein
MRLKTHKILNIFNKIKILILKIMADEKASNLITIEVGNHVHFSSFAVLLEKIAKIDEATNVKGKIEEKKRLIQQFLELWRDKAKQLKETCKDGETVNDSFLPIMRFLLPDISGRVYGLKENKLANYLIEVLSISKNSVDGKKLLNYRVDLKFLLYSFIK